MEYTVNGLARLAGVSVRTLHWYDEIGLLRPARVTEAGYRMYGPDEVDALQSILFYRALGVPLKQIGALMADIEVALHELDSGKYGTILRAKGILPAVDGTWIHFDYVPEECNVRTGSADITGKLCVIGSKLDEAGVAALFGV